jgi:excisionase family DNA binding protein
MELLTVQETADILRVSPVTVRRFIKSRRLAAVRVGRALRVRREDVEKLPARVDPDIEKLANAPVFTMDSSLWKLVGMFRSAEDAEVSSDKYKYSLRHTVTSTRKSKAPEPSPAASSFDRCLSVLLHTQHRGSAS